MTTSPTSAPLVAPSLALRGIDRAYGVNRVLCGFDLVRHAPGIVGLLGPNGSGKSTLLRIVAQVVEHDAGTVEVCGRRIEHSDDPEARRRTGWVPHAPLAWLDDTVAQNLTYAGRLAALDKRAAAQHAARAIEQWGLARVADQALRRLSRGWQQRYSLARADLLEPPVLLLDEPTTGLDDAALQMLGEALERWQRSRIVLVATHDRDWITGHADQLVELGA